jgi:hypothetical protein
MGSEEPIEGHSLKFNSLQSFTLVLTLLCYEQLIEHQFVSRDDSVDISQ